MALSIAKTLRESGKKRSGKFFQSKFSKKTTTITVSFNPINHSTIYKIKFSLNDKLFNLSCILVYGKERIFHSKCHLFQHSL
jgi:hypothetical protein